MVPPVPTSLDAPSFTDLTGAARIAYWGRGVLEIIGVGILVPVVILVLGLPIALVARLVIELAQRF